MSIQNGVKTAEDSSSTLLDYPWLADLDSTLNSVEGSKAFESYLGRCGMLPLLEFIWACDGMKSLVDECPEKCDQLVSCIYKNYIISGAIPSLSNDVVLNIARCLEAHFERPEPSASYPIRKTTILEKDLNLDVFDEAKKEVEVFLRENAFPLFQKAVKEGEVCVGMSSEGNEGRRRRSRSKLASHPELFARALCEKLEGLKVNRKNQ